jgi:hypothetical protein
MRTQYKNGDDINLTECGCDGCGPSMINGLLCHEQGCPHAWKDYARDCEWCGSDFQPETQDQVYCSNGCAEMT